MTKTFEPVDGGVEQPEKDSDFVLFGFPIEVPAFCNGKVCVAYYQYSTGVWYIVDTEIKKGLRPAPAQVTWLREVKK